MSTKLLRVELSNIRSHEHVIFTPELDGITAISGPIGSGKSTIVDSIAWCLYGTKPDGVSKNSEIYRDGADFKNDKAFVKTTFQINNRIFEVERRMMSKSSVECDLWGYYTKEEAKKLPTSSSDDATTKQSKSAAEKRMSPDVPEYISEFASSENLIRVHRAGPASSHTLKEIKRAIGMDEKGFLAAILVQQKQVDSLIAKGGNRAKIIEDLTGISSITTALAESRTEGNALKKMAQMSDASEDELHEAIKNSENLKKEKEKLSKKRSKLQTKLEKEKSSFDDAKNDFNSKSEIFTKTEEIQSKLNKIEAKLEASEEKLVFEIKEKDVKKKQVQKLPPSGDFAEIEKNMKEVSDKQYRFESSITNSEKELSDLQNEKTESDTFVSKSKIQKLEDSIVKKQECINNLSKTERTLTNFSNKIIEQKSEIAKIDRAIKVLETGDGSCPTCLQHVSAVEVAVDSLNNQKEEIKNNIAKNESKVNDFEQKIERAKETISKYEILEEHLTIIENFKGKSSSITEQLSEFKKELSLVNTEYKVIEKVYSNAKQSAEIKAEYQRLLERATSTSDEIEKLKNLIEKGKIKLKETGSVTQEQLELSRNKYQKLSETYSEINNEFSQIDSEYKVMEERINHLDHVVSEQEKKIENHKKTLELVEIATYTTKTIEEFRENRIKNSIPIIESYASEFINRFTEGRFISFRMNEKFDARVVLANGSERPVGLLSGGELSAAAMALRLAISLLISGESSSNLIILDEVLVSQDAASAEIILSTIKEVCKGQVVIIAHNSVIESVVDKTVSL